MNESIDELARTLEANDNGTPSALGSDFDRWPPPHDWLWLLEDNELRNPDWLPDWLTRKDGCPQCGGAFVEIDALKLGTTVIKRVETHDASAPFAGAVVYGAQSVQGARYVCCEGHTTLHHPPSPAMLAILGGGALLGILAMGWYARARAAT